MKKIYLLVASLSLGMLIACGGDSKKDKASNKYDTVKTKVEVEPLADTEQTSEIDINLGNHKYHVSIHRFPDKALPLVVDELEQKFYDNSVDVQILRDGNDFLTRKVTKADFKEFLPENYFKSGILLGMNCDTARTNSKTICFTAQVGQAGEGPAFLILVPTNGGQISVSRDNQMEEIGYK